MKICLGIAIVVSGMVLSTPTDGAAQADCWDCQTETDNPQYGVIHWDQGLIGWVHAPDGKHESWGLHFCSQSHEYSNCLRASGEGADTGHDLADLLDPSSAEDAELIAAFLRAGDRVLLNHERNAFQILACEEQAIVLAHIPLDPVRVAVLATIIKAVDPVVEPAL